MGALTCHGNILNLGVVLNKIRMHIFKQIATVVVFIAANFHVFFLSSSLYVHMEIICKLMLNAKETVFFSCHWKFKGLQRMWQRWGFRSQSFDLLHLYLSLLFRLPTDMTGERSNSSCHTSRYVNVKVVNWTGNWFWGVTVDCHLECTACSVPEQQKSSLCFRIIL